MGDIETNYVEFGGAYVPENSRRISINGSNGETLYCVFLDDKGSKIIYPRQKSTGKFLGFQYLELKGKSNKNISKSLFESKWEKARGYNACEKLDSYKVKSYQKGEENYRVIELYNAGNSATWYVESPRKDIPKIEYENNKGLLFNTPKTRISNMDNAKVRGSSDEDEIIVENSNFCTIDTSEENNNWIFSDNVKIINGKGNKVISGDYDKNTFMTINYTSGETKIKSITKEEGTFTQPK